ncbi:hypothetical protein CsSME_00048443 [Camellia sinensis var. sinensis]
MHAAKGTRASWAWSSLLHGHEVLADGLRWQVFNVQDVIVPRTKSWDITKLEGLVSSEEVNAVATIPISIENINDSYIWHHEARGSYIVKSGYVVMARNDHIFNHVPVDPTEVIFKAARDAMEFTTAQAMLAAPPSVFRQANGVNQAWVSPAQGIFKVNCDVAIQPGTKVGAMPALLRNDQGTLLDGIATKALIASVLQGEVMAICLACVMCDTLHLSRVEVEGDNQGAIKLSVSEDAPPWECAALVADIKALAHKRGQELKFCPVTVMDWGSCKKDASYWCGLDMGAQAIPQHGNANAILVLQIKTSANASLSVAFATHLQLHPLPSPVK